MLELVGGLVAVGRPVLLGKGGSSVPEQEQREVEVVWGSGMFKGIHSWALAVPIRAREKERSAMSCIFTQ